MSDRDHLLPNRGHVGARVVIVGAGVTGLITAIRCVLLGHQVTVLDRGPIPNPRSTSFDQHRAIRALDPADLTATRRAAGAHRRWLELEGLLCAPRPGREFYRRVGVLTAWPAADIASVVSTAVDCRLRVETVEPDAVPYIGFPAGTCGVLERDAGVLLADRVLRAAVRWLSRQPAVRLRPRHPVTAVDPDSGRVTLAGGAVEHGDLVLVAAGPWSPSIVDVPVALCRQTMVYLRPPDGLAAAWHTAPSAGRIGVDGRSWLLPPCRDALLKISTDEACRRVPSVDTDEDEGPWAGRVMASGAVADIDRYTVVAVRRCHYAVDPETGRGHLIRLGTRAWARAASGGDGFRTAPLVADQIAGALLGFAA